MSSRKVDEYQLICEKLQEYTGIADIEMLIKEYQDTKEHNITLGKYVEDLSLDLENLESQIQTVKNEISSLKENDKSADIRKAQAINDLEEEFLNTQTKALDYNKKSEMISETLGVIKTAVDAIFSNLGCKSFSDRSLLTEEESLTEALGLIEQRTTEIISMFEQCHADKPNFQVSTKEESSSSTKIEIDAPICAEKEPQTEEEEAQGPLSWEDMMIKAQRRVKTVKKR